MVDITLVVPTTSMDDGLHTAMRAAKNAGVPSVSLEVVLDAEGNGFTSTVNRGLRAAMESGGDACLLVDDCMTEDGWLKKLSDVAHQQPRVWFTGPSGPCRTQPQSGGRRGSEALPRVVSHLAGFCLYVKRQALDMVGLLDERFKHYGSDVDWQWRARRLGARSVWVPSVYVEHELHPPRNPWWVRDNKLFKTVWP